MTPEWRRAYTTCGPAAAAILSTRHLFTTRQPSLYTQAARLLHPANDQRAAFVSELQAAKRLALSTLLYKLVPFVSTLYLKKKLKITNTSKRVLCVSPFCFLHFKGSMCKIDEYLVVRPHTANIYESLGIDYVSCPYCHLTFDLQQ